MLAMVVRPGKPVRHAGRYRVPERFGLSGHDLGVDAIPPDLDRWLADPTVRVAHRRESEAARDRLWQAAQQVRLRDTHMLGRLIRWRIPGVAAATSFDELFRNPPFTVLAELEG